ncbi:hypothetical protein SARC_16157 [Sphaeroforma arctica JP610]|uniref:Uncharacterized protein n=1 Tax=Sphaeroforma arctica JP610 TaxID=667725 RepID=A0A0L0F3W5_9EUKA|nr:hypothetical protein SARC_16157 [Sphaeroforma arctica JP610]KNC71306.1 hypothetical protein SARC_16157 [Sphaeroforma arctica JP610]|eukprot:XP_014145208.1 hypothetical protein SARC_16157 [Sphaeroforma arctica JP610]
MLQATVLTGNNTEVLYRNDNQFGPFEAGNYNEWFGSNQIVKVDTDYCLQVQPGVHQGCARQAWTCDGWNYIGTENYRGYDTCYDSSDRWVTIESAQTVDIQTNPLCC